MGQKLKIFALYYEEEDEELVRSHMQGIAAEIKKKFIDLTNPFTGRPGTISDLVQELLTRSTMDDERP